MPQWSININGIVKERQVATPENMSPHQPTHYLVITSGAKVGATEVTMGLNIRVKGKLQFCYSRTTPQNHLYIQVEVFTFHNWCVLHLHTRYVSCGSGLPKWPTD